MTFDCVNERVLSVIHSEQCFTVGIVVAVPELIVSRWLLSDYFIAKNLCYSKNKFYGILLVAFLNCILIFSYVRASTVAFRFTPTPLFVVSLPCHDDVIRHFSEIVFQQSLVYITRIGLQLLLNHLQQY